VNKGVLIWGYLASFVLLLGAIFLNHNLVAGKVLYLTGFFAFNLGYLIPLFWVIFKQNQENKIGLVLVFGILGFITFLTGVSFFVVNWGGGIILIYVGAGILILAILSIIALTRRFYETHIDSWFPVLVFGVFIVGSLLIGMVHRHVMRAFTINNMESVEICKAIQEKNKRLYDNLSCLDSNSVFFNQFSTEIAELNESTTTLINNIEQLKINLILRVEGDEYKMIDGKTLSNLVPVQSNVEINSVSRFMLKKNGGTAYKLRKQLDIYKNKILTLIPTDDSVTIQFIRVNLSTTAFAIGNRKFNKTWEYQYFYNMPLITVLSNLSNIQKNILTVENEMLNFYYRKMHVNCNTGELKHKNTTYANI